MRLMRRFKEIKDFKEIKEIKELKGLKKSLIALLSIITIALTMMISTAYAQDMTGEDVANLIQEGNYSDNNYSYESNDIGDDRVGGDTDGAYNAIYEGLLSLSTEIDIRDYALDVSELKPLFTRIVNDNPDLFYVKGGYSYSYMSSGVVTKFRPGYIASNDVVQTMKTALAEKETAAASVVKTGMSNLEKALALHDYLATDIQYDYANYNNGSIPAISHTAYGAIVNKIAVCDGYSLAYKFYLKKYAGIDSVVVSSNSMNHAWNLVNIDGTYYHVDVTWDDPITTISGKYVPKEFYTEHTYFLFSDTARSDHYGWDNEGISCSNTQYNSAVWSDAGSYMNYYHGYWYYTTEDGVCMRVNIASGDKVVLKNLSYMGNIALDGNRLYYNIGSSLYMTNTTFSKTTKLITYNLNSVGYGYTIDGLGFKDGDLYYSYNGSSYRVDLDTLVDDDAILREFVVRMYTIVLDREPESAGCEAWIGYLKNNQCSGAQMIQAFVEGDEFVAKNVTDADYIDIIYRAVMGREADVSGKSTWLSVLGNGMSRTFVLSNFVGSTEFTELCDSYYITRGSILLTEGRDRNYNVTSFVQRLYTKVFNRAAEADGLNTWCDAILDKKVTPQEAAKLFVFSDETKARNLSDSEYIKMLYRTFMGRECEDTDTLNGWVSYMNSNGQSRTSVFDMFAASEEFGDIVESYGL